MSAHTALKRSIFLDVESVSDSLFASATFILRYSGSAVTPSVDSTATLLCCVAAASAAFGSGVAALLSSPCRANALSGESYSEKAVYSDFAVLYRTNAQSRAVEEALRKRGIPYKIYGGHSFYERAEVKDVMAYLRLVVNPKDNEAFKRIVNVPARGIGDTTVGNLQAAASSADVSIWEAIHTGDLASFGIKSAAANRLADFCRIIGEMSAKATSVNAYDLATEVLIRTGYMEYLKSDNSVEGQSRLENVEELFNSIKNYLEEIEAEALEDAAYASDEDSGAGATSSSKSESISNSDSENSRVDSVLKTIVS